MWLRFLALACLVGAAFAGPVQRQSESRCAKKCHPSPHRKINIEPGKAYVYHYRSQNNVTFAGKPKESATIECRAELHFETRCEGHLICKDVRIHQKLSQDERDDLKKKLEIPMKFAYDDGDLDHVCPSSEESKQSLNIKKGLLSAFVIKMTSLEKNEKVEEKDSFGKCLTEYIVQNNGEKVIKKVKDLSKCTETSVTETSYLKTKLPSYLHNKEDHMECNLSLKNDIHNNIDCVEKQKLINVWKDNETLKFTGRMHLSLLETKPAERISWQEPVNQEDITYSIDEPRQGDRHEKEVKRILKSICSKNDKVIDISIGKEYITLVTHLKNMTYHELSNNYQSLKDGTVCSSDKVRNIFGDALAVAATDACIKLMVEMMVNDDVSIIQRKLWPVALTLRSHITEDTVAAMKPLLKKDQSSSTLIPIAKMIRNLCLYQSEKDCRHIRAVEDIVTILAKSLGSRCSADDEKQKKAVLIAFGNMGHHGSAHDQIMECVKSRSLTTELRLIAIRSFRQINHKRPREFVQIINDKREPHELRIEAFSSVLTHADGRQLRELKVIAEKEPNAQVSSYMDTRIRNMKHTKSPRHQDIKKLLQDIEIHPKTGDYWKHSKNMEYSTFNNASGLGLTSEIDFIHGVKTGLPISLYTRFDGVIHGKENSLTEFGMRTEGFEDILLNMIAMKDKMPKLEELRRRLEKNPTLEEVKEEIKGLLKEVFGDNRPEISMYFRLLGIQYMTLSTSDLSSGLEEMLKIAELLNKLAHGKDADFSHSFVFINSKLVIPSITGRSYSIHLAGSSTVGLTAKAKADILNLPRNADIHLHVQPSVNVEISTKVGLESASHRPCIKHVSRVHFESDVDFKVEVRGGRLAIARVTLPSENIALAKLSTDVVEVDQDHNEKSIFPHMQKKIDYTFEHLRKPLGIIATAQVEVPKPFVIKSFPFIMPFGNGEIALKTADVKSYEIRLEIPKQVGPNMKCKASFDTPGSKVSRLFEAAVELKGQRGQKDLLLELTSPFETIGARCSLTNNDDHTGGSLELYTSKKQLASANITHKFASSRSRNIHEVSAAYSILRQDPSRFDGKVTVIKGRKTHITFDLKTNKPPLSLKGTIMKEGRLELSSMSDWKISSEAHFESPAFTVNVRKTVERRSKQSQAMSANIGIDYQLRGQKQHSFTFSGTSQKSSSKVNTIAKLESTQYPRANMYLTWDMQREGGMKNDIKLKCGQNLDQTCIHLKQKSHFPKTGSGSCSTSLDIPHRDIHYELKIDHEVDMKSEKPKLHIGLDLCYKQDKHITGVIDLKCESKSPLKASGRVAIKSPYAEYIYEDGIEETSHNVFVGKAKFQHIKEGKNKVSQIQYKYKKSNKDSKVHHEIESSIQTPLSRSPINSKASIELSSESLAIAGHLGPEHSVQAELKEYGDGHINIKFPMIEGTVDLTTKGAKKTAKADLKTKSRRMVASAIADLGDMKKLEIRVQPDFDRSPEKRIVASIGGEKKYIDSKYIYTGLSRLEFLDKLNVSLVEKGGASIFEDHESILKVQIENRDTVIIKLKNKIVDGRIKTTIVVSKRNVEKISFELDAGLKQTSHKKEVSVEMSVSSQDHSFEDTHVYFKNQVTQSGSSKNIQTAISLKKNHKVYKTELNSDLQPDRLEVKAQMQTPHVNYEKIAAGLSLQVSDSSLSSSANIVYSDNRKISIQTEIESKRHRLSLNSKISSESETVGVLQVTIDNHRHKKSLEASIDANNKRVCDIQGSIRKSSQETKLEGSVKLAHLPEAKFRGFNISIHSAQSSALLSANVQLINNEKISWISEIKEQDDTISATTSIDTRRKHIKAHISIKNQEDQRSLLSYVDVDGHRKGDVEISITSTSQNIELKARSKTDRTPEISALVKYEKTGETFLVTANVMKGTSPLLSTSLNRLSYHGEEKLLMKTNTLGEPLLHLEISKQVSGENIDQYRLTAKGKIPEVHITFSRNRNDKNSVSTELRACRREQSEICYTLKSLHKHLNYRLDLEKSVGGSYSHTVGTLHMLVTAEMSKITLERNEKKYGYVLKVHRRQHDNDRCSLDCSFYKGSGTSRVRASILHNERHMNLEALIIPDIDHPTRKLSLEIKKEINPDNQEISGLIKMSHPRMSQPLLLTGKLRPVGQHDHTPLLYSGRFVLHSGPVWGKTWIFEVMPNIEHETDGIRTMEYKVYPDDKSIYAYLKLTIQKSKSEKKIGYEWQYVSRDGEKKGALTLTLSERNGGKNIKVSFSTPSVNYEVQGSPNDINLSIATAGRKLKEINIKISDSCAVLEFRKSGKSDPEFKTHICVNKREGKRLQLLKVNVQYRHHDCVDIRVALNPEKPSIVDVVLKCNKDESCRALREKIRELLSELQREIKSVVRQSKKDVVEPLRNHLQHLYDYLSSKLENLRKEYSRKSEEIKQYLLRLLHSSIPTPIREAYEKHYQDIHREAVRYYRKAKEIGSRYWSLRCGWLCDGLKSALKYLSVEEARKLIVSKVDEAKQLLTLGLEKFRLITPSDVVNFVKNAIKKGKDFVERKIIAIFGGIVGRTIVHQLRKIADKIEVYVIQYANRMETKIRQTIIDTVDAIIQKIHHLIAQDEDLQTAQHLILNAKEEVVNAWRNKEEIISKFNAKRAEICIKENLKKAVDKQVEVLKYDSKEGEYQFRFIHLDYLLGKLREILSRFR